MSNGTRPKDQHFFKGGRQWTALCVGSPWVFDKERLVRRRLESQRLERSILDRPGKLLLAIEIIGDGSPQSKPHYVNLSDSLRQAGYHHFYLNVANLDNTIAELRRRGVTIVQEAFEVEAINRRLAFFRDPLGNLIELAQIIAKR